MEKLILKVLEITIFTLITYSTFEDIRRTAISDLFPYITYVLSFIYSILAFLFNNNIYYLINLLISIFLLNLFYLFFIYGYIGDADGFYIASLINLVGFDNLILLFPIGVLFLSISNLIIIFYRIYNKKWFFINTIILLTITLLIFYFLGLIPTLLFLLVIILKFYLNEDKYLFYLEKKENILPLDVIRVGSKKLLVVDETYTSLRIIPKPFKIIIPVSLLFKNIINKSDDFIDIRELKEKKYYRKVPLPFLPLVFGIALVYYIVGRENIIKFVVSTLLFRNQLSP